MENYNLGGSEQELIAQRLKLAQMLHQQGMMPINPKAGYRISPMEGFAKLMQAYVGRKGIDLANADITTLAKSRQDATTAENEKLARLLGGGPAMPMPTRFDDDGNSTAGLDVAAQAPNQRAALALLLKSQDPQRQQIGLQGMMTAPKSALDFMGKLDPKDYSPESFAKFQQTLNPSVLTPRVKMEFVEGQAVNPYETKPGTVIPKLLSPDSVVTRAPDGTLIPNVPVIDAKAQIAREGRAVTNVNLPPAEKAFEVETAKLDAKQLDEFRDSAQKAASGLARIREMQRLDQEGVVSGTMAEGRVGVANFFNTLGAPVDQKKLGNSQEYIKHAKELTLSLLKDGVGTSQISNADLKFVNETVPQLENSPQARKNLIAYIERRLGESVDRFQRADQYARQKRGLGGFNYQPVKPPGNASGPLSQAEQQELEQLRKRFGR